MRNAEHFYFVGLYEKSRAYFVSLLSIGTVREQKIARSFLAKPELKALTHKRAHPAPAPSTQSTEPLLEEPTSAPEQVRSVGREDLLPFHLSGYLRNETAFRISPPEQLSKFRTVAFAAGTGQFSDALSYKVSGRLYYDAAYSLTDHYSKPVSDDERHQEMLRDTYLDFSKGDWDVRAGKQQIVWGEALGLFYADVVNAKDLREFVLPDFEFIRIPEWATDVEYTKEDFHAEFVWLPFPDMDHVGRPGSEYAFALPVPPGAQVQFGEEQTPARTLDNSEVGGRLSYRAGGWDIGFFHLRTWDKAPVYTTAFAQPGVITLTATHPRLTVDGITFAKEINDVVLKGEGIYSWDKYFQSLNPATPFGIVPKDVIDYLVGADYVFPGSLDTSLQIGQRLVRDYEEDLYQQKALRTQVTLWLKRPFWNNRIEPELLIVKDLNTRDVMGRSKVSYKFASHWRATVGLDVFGGSSDGPFGEFAARNRGYGELRLDF